jgi:hypothetical protein
LPFYKFYAKIVTGAERILFLTSYYMADQIGPPTHGA